MKLGTIMVIGLLAGACTHQRAVTPNYAPKALASVKPASICPHGEVVSVTASNQSPEGNSAGTTHAGVHTFEYRFDSDPSVVLKRGLEAALQKGGCRAGQPAAATLVVGILRLEARGLECGFMTCDGEGQAMINATVSDSAGRPIAQKMITAHSTQSCGMAICNEAEASEIATEVLSDSIAKTIASITETVARQLSTAQPSTAVGANVPRT